MQGHLVDTEVLGDLRDRDPVFTRPGHAHDIVAELLRIGGGHGAHPSRPPAKASQIRCHPSVRQSPSSVDRGLFAVAMLRACYITTNHHQAARQSNPSEPSLVDATSLFACLERLCTD